MTPLVSLCAVAVRKK